MLTLGTSLKMYFGYQQTLLWCQKLASLLRCNHWVYENAQLELFTFPSMPVIKDAMTIFMDTPMAVGAQNISSFPPGAWTGETSAVMLKEMGCRYVEIGHAERRRYFYENDNSICKKTQIALQNGLIPVICIGEKQRVNVSEAKQVAISQARVVLDSLDDDIKGDIIFAWEPWWAIGASQPAEEDYVREVCSGLREALRNEPHGKHRVIYGGSAGSDLLSRLYPDVDGIFFGRFVHKPEVFQSILDEANKIIQSYREI